MSPEQQTLNEITHELYGMSIEQRHLVNTLAEAIETFVTEKGPEGHFALALVGARIAARGVA